jgi:NADPH-dependent curcumin reductase CurA
MISRNGQWVLARTPAEGWPVEGDFRFRSTPASEPEPGQLLSRTIYLSLDPYQWGRRRNGIEKPGDVCHGRTVSQVVASRHPDYTEGDYLFNTNGWQNYGLTGSGIDPFGYMHPRKLDPAQAPISTAVGVLGMLGLTAYSGLIVQCDPQPGETVVVSAASGGVGQVAGQLAKIRGCRVVGVTSTRDKCDLVTDELGFDAAVSHLDNDFADQLAASCPDGIDVYYENVGGKVYEGVLGLLNRHARITLCGMISQYGNAAGASPGEVWMEMGQPTFESKEVQAHSLFVGNFVADYQDRFLSEMAAWIEDGLMVYREDVWEGLERAPDAFSAMLNGGNFGKTLVQVSEDPTDQVSEDPTSQVSEDPTSQVSADPTRSGAEAPAAFLTTGRRKS